MSGASRQRQGRGPAGLRAARRRGRGGGPARLLEVIIDNLRGRDQRRGHEYLHQLRIAVRRSRTVQRQLARRVPRRSSCPAFAASSGGCSRPPATPATSTSTCSGSTSCATMLPERMRGDLGPLRQVLAPQAAGRQRRDGARARLARGPQELLADWEMLLESLVELPARGPARRHAADRRAGRRADPQGLQADRAHGPGDRRRPARPRTTTSCARRARSCATCSSCSGSSCSTSERVAPMVDSLKAAPGRARPPPGPRGPGRRCCARSPTRWRRCRAARGALLAMGVLIDRLRADERAARVQFAERFAELSAAKTPAAVGQRHVPLS